MTDTLRYARTTSERATEQMTQEDDFMRNQSIEYHTARYRSRNDPTPEHQINAGRRNFPGEIKENPDVYDLAMYSQEQNIYNHQQDWDYTRPMRVQGLEMDDVYRQKELNAMNSLIDKPITYMEARDAHRFDAVSI
ncbi:hypothetical protein TVWG_00030 [Tetraselmis viridis virus N1]|nr:hypothetical protein TVWG_00030 [Tetraselmis viridis virus N1]